MMVYVETEWEAHLRIALRKLVCCLIALGCGAGIAAQTDQGLPLLGKVRPRPAQEIGSSPWSIGGETLA